MLHQQCCRLSQLPTRWNENRSVRLVIIGGATVTISYLVVINESLRILYGPGHSLPWLWSSLLLFFLTPGLFGSYICRAIRLAVVFHPWAKRSLPWLIPVSDVHLLGWLPVVLFNVHFCTVGYERLSAC